MTDERDSDALTEFMDQLVELNPHHDEFHQAVHDVMQDVLPFIDEHPRYRENALLERLTEPDRIITFRVTWEDDDGGVNVNRAYRVQFNNAIGPYKGGLRFHPSVNESILKFLGFEQIFKNSLTGMPMGGGKGGSNFDPRGRSDREIMRFCQALMTELFRHVGAHTDVPAGDIGVGEREVSYLFGQYKRLENRFTGTITGKGLAYGGSPLRTQATGYGVVYFAQHMLDHADLALEGKRVSVSGSGNVAIYCIEKLLEKGAVVVSASDSDGTVYLENGFDRDTLLRLKDIKEVQQGRIHELADGNEIQYRNGDTPWSIPVDIAMPCATQNELDGEDAQNLVDNGVRAVVEGANMPCTSDAVECFRDNGILYGPGKAANAGGVAVSGLEQSQNAMRTTWTIEEVDQRLTRIMQSIHARCLAYGKNGPVVDYAKGANIAGFVRVADAMLAYGIT